MFDGNNWFSCENRPIKKDIRDITYMEQKEVFIHVGYPKTGTTTLQKHLFPKHSQIDYVRAEGATLSFVSALFYAGENSFKKRMSHVTEELERLYRKSDKAKNCILFLYMYAKRYVRTKII